MGPSNRAMNESADSSFVRPAQDSLIKRITAEALDFIYPPQCAVCLERIESSRCTLPVHMRSIVCKNCLPRNVGRKGSFCITCFEPCDNAAEPCIYCTVFPPNLRTMRFLWDYDNKAKSLIKSYKYKLARPLAAFFAVELAQLVNNEFCSLDASAPRWDCLLAVPSRPKAISKRGFSHLGQIGTRLGSLLSIPFKAGALSSSKRLRSAQVEIPLTQRYTSIETAFKANQAVVAGKRILLFDDVVTTGASIFTAAAVLQKAGALSVDVISLARSRQFQRNRVLASIYRDSLIE